MDSSTSEPGRFFLALPVRLERTGRVSRGGVVVGGGSGGGRGGIPRLEGRGEWSFLWWGWHACTVQFCQQILRACIQLIEAIGQLLLQCGEPFIGSGQDAIGCASGHGWLITLT